MAKKHSIEKTGEVEELKEISVEEKTEKQPKAVRSKKQLKEEITVTDIVLYSYILLTFIFLVFCVLNTFQITHITAYDGGTVGYVVAYSGIIATMLIYIGINFLEKNKRIFVPNITKIVAYTFCFIFFCIYPYFRLFELFITDYIFNIFFGFFLSIIGLSIYYNYLKNDRDQVRAKPFMVMLFAVFFSISAGVLVETITFLIDVIFETNIQLGDIATSSRNDTMLDLITLSVSSLFMSFVIYLSLKKKKTFANALLIDVRDV